MIELDLAGAEQVDQLRRHARELEAALHGFRMHAVQVRDFLDRSTGFDQNPISVAGVGRVHRLAHFVLGCREQHGVLDRHDTAAHRVVGGDVVVFEQVDEREAATFASGCAERLRLPRADLHR
ncbi:hypothetical protein, partial [Burkholderia cenocepacia]|uniref:hypothetical protein n=1 Tax=Burkholderia cenocepacia TaxID=95486 RepID=UPI002741858F